MITWRDAGRWIRIVYWEDGKQVEASGMIRDVDPEKLKLASRSVKGGDDTFFEVPRSRIIAFGWADIFKWNTE